MLLSEGRASHARVVSSAFLSYPVESPGRFHRSLNGNFMLVKSRLPRNCKGLLQFQMCSFTIALGSGCRCGNAAPM
jgi:hypothetical protein